jgi:hypothetical protein
MMFPESRIDIKICYFFTRILSLRYLIACIWEWFFAPLLKLTSATSDTCKTLGEILLGSLNGDDIIWMYKKYLY